MEEVVSELTGSELPGQTSGLSYKFQRLRERLRDAVRTGELAGKLPGERLLAKRFHCNAKTLSKALTDLAAEGLLDRSIGRGTYVKSPGQTAPAKTSNWLIIADEGSTSTTLVRLLQESTPQSTLITRTDNLRPSFLKAFDAVINTSSHTSDSFLRTLIIRNIPVISANRELDVMSMDTVGCDRVVGAASLTRDLILAGHRDILVVESLPRSPVLQSVQQAAARHAPGTRISSCAPGQTASHVAGGPSVILVDSTSTAAALRPALESQGFAFPRDISLVAVGCCDENHPCSGYYSDCAIVAQTIVEVIKTNNATRPSVLWITPRFVDKGTLIPRDAEREDAAA